METTHDFEGTTHDFENNVAKSAIKNNKNAKEKKPKCRFLNIKSPKKALGNFRNVIFSTLVCENVLSSGQDV